MGVESLSPQPSQAPQGEEGGKGATHSAHLGTMRAVQFPDGSLEGVNEYNQRQSGDKSRELQNHHVEAKMTSEDCIETQNSTQKGPDGRMSPPETLQQTGPESQDEPF